MSFKSGMIAARRHGVPVSGVQYGPRNGKFYFNTHGHKVYGEPPTTKLPGNKVPAHLVVGNAVHVHVENGWQGGKVVKVFPKLQKVHVQLHTGEIAEAHFRHEQVRPTHGAPPPPPPMVKEVHSNAAPPPHIATGKVVSISTIDGLPGTHTGTVVKVTKNSATVQLHDADETHVKASFHELKPAAPPGSMLSLFEKHAPKVTGPGVEASTSRPPVAAHVPPPHNMTSGDLNSISYITQKAASATALGIERRARADAAPKIDLTKEPRTCSRKGEVPWSPEVASAISAWSNSRYKQYRAADAGLSEYKYEKDSKPEPLHDDHRKNAAILRSFLDKHSITQDGVLYRGIKVSTEQLHELLGQTHIKEATYASLSRNAPTSRSFASVHPSPPNYGVVVRILKGGRGVNIEKNGMDEYEVLSSGRQTYKVLGVHKEVAQHEGGTIRYIMDVEPV